MADRPVGPDDPTELLQPPRRKRRPLTRKERWGVAAIAVGFVAVAVFWLWLLVFRGHGGPAPVAAANSPSPGVTSSAPQSTSPPVRVRPRPSSTLPGDVQANLRALQGDINSPSQDVQALALVKRERASFLQHQPLLPAGVTLRIDQASFTRYGQRVATVVATDSTGQRYLLGLFRHDEHSRYLLAITKELS